MLHIKDIKNVSELKSAFVHKYQKEEFFLESIDLLKLNKFHATFSTVKKRGISALLLIRVLLTFPFIDQKSVASFSKSAWSSFIGFGKDAYYRLKNNSKINWRNFLFSIVITVLRKLSERSERYNNEQESATALIFDDTTLGKTGKNIEGCSRIFDHVIGKSILGFTLLVMGYYNGTLFLPLDFSFHRSKGKNKKKPFGLKQTELKKQYRKKRDKKTAGAKRKKELDLSKITVVAKMIREAKKRGISANYVLTDSWFTCWELVSTTVSCGMHYLGMFSKVRTLFEYQGKSLNYKQILKINRKKVKRNRTFKLYYIRTIVEWKGQKVALFFSRRGKKGKWRTIVCTDTSLSFQQAMKVYQIRWTIEVFFKECKQLLGLGKSQANDFDTQIADTTITMIQYMLLALRNSIDKYETLGALFRDMKEKNQELRLHQKLVALFIVIIEIIEALFEQEDSAQIIFRIIHHKEQLAKLLAILEPSDSKLPKEKPCF